MINKLTVKNYLGESLTLDLFNPYATGLAITDIDGIGASKADINTTEIAMYDGSIFNSSRVESRDITLTLGIIGTDDKSIEECRALIYKFFPIKRATRLIFDTDTRLISIDCYVESNDPTIFSTSKSSYESAKISLVCPDPYFVLSDGSEDIWHETLFSGVVPKFSFEFPNGESGSELNVFGEYVQRLISTVFYEGDSEIGVKIVIHALGEFKNLTIYNTITRERMIIDTDKMATISGGKIQTGDVITINTQKGEKSFSLLREGTTYNLLNCMKKGSDWFTLSKGDNLFSFTAEEGHENIQFSILNRVYYDGV